MSALSDLGPTLPSRGDLRVKAMEAQKIAQIISEITVAGPRCDVPRAARLMDKLRAVVGPAPEGEN